MNLFLRDLFASTQTLNSTLVIWHFFCASILTQRDLNHKLPNEGHPNVFLRELTPPVGYSPHPFHKVIYMPKKGEQTSWQNPLLNLFYSKSVFRHCVCHKYRRHVSSADHICQSRVIRKGQHPVNITGCDLLHPVCRDPKLMQHTQAHYTSSSPQLAVWFMSQGQKQQVSFLWCCCTFWSVCVMLKPCCWILQKQANTCTQIDYLCMHLCDFFPYFIQDLKILMQQLKKNMLWKWVNRLSHYYCVLASLLGKFWQ